MIDTVVLAILFAIVLDLLMGDPAWLPHPVVLFGRIITASEKLLRGMFPAGPRGERLAGMVLALVLPVAVFAVSATVLALVTAWHPVAGFLLQVFWCAQCLAMHGLVEESMSVVRVLRSGDLPAARTAVGRIVGRDTAELDAAGVTRAAIETVAENCSDGVVAPLLFMALGGAPAALAYKAVNTLDSMVGYKSDRYLWFGRASARLDDVVNWIPARLPALCWIAACPLSGASMAGAWRIWLRDRQHHTSPNAGQIESACAGGLGIRLIGPATYGGVLFDKPYLGDATRPVEVGDIARANRTMCVACVFAAVICLGMRIAVDMILGGAV